MRTPWSEFDQAELEDSSAQAALNRFLQYGPEPGDDLKRLAFAQDAVRSSLEWQESKWRST